MTGAYFSAPDCLEELDARRSREELLTAAQDLQASGILVISAGEFDLIKREVSLAYKWQGRRLLVHQPYRVG
jgi:hypothetical protein